MRAFTLAAVVGCVWALVSADERTTDREKQVGAVLDDWHQAAAAADEARYFGHLAPSAVFLGTDATERWNLEAFRAFAKPYFAKGKAWTFKATRRAVMFSKDGTLAWFDEDLATEALGPCRGTGVLLFVDGHWKITHYSLSLTVPNDAFDEVKKVIEAAGKAPKKSV
jgi:ketosteroid isomerase-like protein